MVLPRIGVAKPWEGRVESVVEAFPLGELSMLLPHFVRGQPSERQQDATTISDL
jgi:hypothetical protein